MYSRVSMGSGEIKRMVLISLTALGVDIVRKSPSMTPSLDRTWELTSHHTHPVSAATWTAPQTNSLHAFTWEARLVFAEITLTNSLLVGTLA